MTISFTEMRDIAMARPIKVSLASDIEMPLTQEQKEMSQGPCMLLKSSLEQGHAFDLGNAPVFNTDTAIDMFLKGELKHPYPMYMISYIEKETRFMEAIVSGEVLEAVFKDSAGSITIATFVDRHSIVRKLGGTIMDPNQIALQASGSVKLQPSIGSTYVCTTKVAPVGFSYLGAKYYNTDTDQQMVRQALGESALTIVRFLYMLAQPATQRTVVEPARAERRRAMARGKPAPKPYTVITYVEPPVSSPAHVAKGGHHASPVAHDRRGHYATRGGTTYWVRACRVNEGKQPFVPRSHYEVAAEG